MPSVLKLVGGIPWFPWSCSWSWHPLPTCHKT